MDVLKINQEIQGYGIAHVCVSCVKYSVRSPRKKIGQKWAFKIYIFPTVLAGTVM